MSKLTDTQRAEIRASLASDRVTAKAHGVSRRLVQFIRHPDKVAQNLAARDRRGGWRRYYDPEKHAAKMRRLRAKKKAITAEMLSENLC